MLPNYTPKNYMRTVKYNIDSMLLSGPASLCDKNDTCL